MIKAVAAIDIAPFLHGDAGDKAQVTAAVAQSCRELGFLVIAGHGLPAADLERTFALVRRFTELPQAAKDRWRPTGPSKQRGYHAFATRGLAYTLGQQVPPDLRETLFVGPLDDHRAAYAGLPEALPSYWPNTLPTEPEGLDRALVTLYRGFERLAADLLRLFALALGLAEDHFADKIERHFSILSCHHYPALSTAPEPGQLRAGAHTDFGALTILAATEGRGGLEVRLPDGSWAAVQPGPGELAVNLGDMMARWTNERWASTLHRVANPPDLDDALSRRLSIGYFVHPNYDTTIECFPTCLEPGEVPRHPPITAGEHIAMKIEKSHQAGAGADRAR